ncbi:MAG: lysophospholipid acyltransferase family protein [Flavobacteriaceae bacterium]
MQLLIFLISYPILMGLSLLPYPLLYGLSNVLSLLIHRFFRFRLTVVRKNLKLSFPEMSDKERSVIEKQFYRHFCDVFLEMIKNLTISEKQIKKRFKFINIDLINRCEEQKQSTILLLGHYSNWEGMLSIGYHLKGKAYGIYSPLSNKYFNRLITKSREKHQAYLVSRYQTINFIRESVKKGKFALYGFINDQSPQPKPKNYWRDFMGVKVPVFTGAERMAKEFNFPVYYTEIKRVKRGYYTATISLLKENPSECTAYEITDLFTEKLEKQIRRDPAQYLWSHNRFKHAYLAPK